MKHDSLFRNENMKIHTIHKRETIDFSKNKGKLIKLPTQNKFKKYENLALPEDISQINDYFRNLQILNPSNKAKQNFSELEKKHLIDNEDIIVPYI